MYFKYFSCLCLGLIMGSTFTATIFTPTNQHLATLDKRIESQASSTDNALNNCSVEINEQLRLALLDTLETYHSNQAPAIRQQQISDNETAIAETAEFPLLDEAIAKGNWDSHDSEAFNETLSSLSDAEVFEFNRRLSQAINTGDIEVIGDGILP